MLPIDRDVSAQGMLGVLGIKRVLGIQRVLGVLGIQGVQAMSHHEKINYLEFPCRDINKTKAFFSSAFVWTFIDYGPEYTSFSKADTGLDGGFFLSDQAISTDSGSALVVLYSDNLEQTQAKVIASGGSMVKPIFTFPGGRRFHFADPNSNEYAVWSDAGL